MRIALAFVLSILLAGAASAQAETVQCAAGGDLFDAEQFDAAKQRFNKALDEGAAGRDCGVQGLKDVAAAEEAAAAEKKDAEDNQTIGDVAGDVRTFLTKNLVWIGLVLLVWIGLLAIAAIRNEKRVRIRAPASSEDLATAVAAAARAQGAGEEGSAKIYTASDETDSTTAADVAKIFRVPGAVPIGDLLRRPPFSGWMSIRLDVAGSIAGGWAVIELTYREPLVWSRRARIALQLGDVEDDEKAEVLALVGGAWLNAMLSTDGAAPVRDRDTDAVTAHALFRAGADRQALGKTQIARACYGAMPAVSAHKAPFAWAGSRLNEMMALKVERRWLEAAHLADVIGDFPTDVIGESEERYFGVEKIKELRVRQRYMTAVVRVDHWYAVTLHPNEFSPPVEDLQKEAKEATTRLSDSVGTKAGSGGSLAPVHAAGRMVVLAYKAAAPDKEATIEDVRDQLGVEPFAGKRHAVTAAGYYDAACVVSLLLEDLSASDRRHARHVRHGLWLLETAVAATLEGRRARVREMAKSDPMLEHLEQADFAGFAKALGEPPPDPPQEPTPAERLVAALASLASRPPRSLAE